MKHFRPGRISDFLLKVKTTKSLVFHREGVNWINEAVTGTDKYFRVEKVIPLL